MELNQANDARRGFWQRVAHTVFMLLDARANRYLPAASARKMLEHRDRCD